MKKSIRTLAAALAAITALSCTSVTAFADTLKKSDGVMYRYSDSGEVKGKYTGWANTSKGRYYYKYGVKVKNNWIKNKKGEYRYLGSDGRMVTGWYDVKQGREGRFSWFDENGVWDGQTYYSRYNEADRFGKTVKIRVSRNEVVSEPYNGNWKIENRYWTKNGSKTAKNYVMNNTEYELYVPLAAAEQLNVGDKLVVNADIFRGDKVDGKYTYHLNTVGIGHGVMSENAPDHVWKTIERFDLMNNILVLKNGKLKLDLMFGAFGLDWDITENEDFTSDVWWHGGVYYDSINKSYFYGLFGGYNEYNSDTGKYIYRNNISEKTLLKLMKNKIAEHIAYKEELEKNADVDWNDWAGNMLGLWLDVTVTEIPELPAPSAPEAHAEDEIVPADDEVWTSTASMNTIPEQYTDYIVMSGMYYVNIENEPSWQSTRFEKSINSPGGITANTSSRVVSEIPPWQLAASILPVGTQLWWAEGRSDIVLAELNGKLIPYVKMVEG